MGVVTALQREKPVANRQRDFEVWQRFESARLLRNELTDASERLTVPMKNKISFVRATNGELYSEHGESVGSVLEKGRQSIAAIMPSHPDYAFELERRDIELANYKKQTKLGHLDMLVEFSVIPDAVRDNHTTIDGYDRKRMKSIVRVTQRIGDRIETVHISLDGSNLTAVAAAAESIGHTLPKSFGSEAILAAPAELADCHEFSADDVADRIRESYDDSMSQQFGGEWYAGRRPMNMKDGLAFIEQQSDLITQHMEIISGIEKRVRDSEERIQLQEMARFDFAAALDDRLHGKQVTSVSDSGDVARDEGRSYDGDCPTSVGAQSNSNVEASLQSLGYMQGEVPPEQRQINGEKVTKVLKCVNCPFCKKSVDALVTKTQIACPEKDGCGTVLNTKTGKTSSFTKESIGDNEKEEQPNAANQSNESDEPEEKSELEYIKTEYSIGGADKIYRDKKTGAVGSLKELASST